MPTGRVAMLRVSAPSTPWQRLAPERHFIEVGRRGVEADHLKCVFAGPRGHAEERANRLRDTELRGALLSSPSDIFKMGF